MGWGGGRPLVDILEAKARALGVEVVTDARAVALVPMATGSSASSCASTISRAS
jgi:phytoene dehydrogenase-like protein